MKKIVLMSAFLFIVINGCSDVDDESTLINLGVNSTTTSIKSIKQTDNNVNVVFGTTIGSKYSVQIIPFGKDEPVKTMGFTATSEEEQKQYNLNDLSKGDYDLVLIDIKGTETKTPLLIK
jgi:cellulose biosynthesis protein BcsQ